MIANPPDAPKAITKKKDLLQCQEILQMGQPEPGILIP